MNPQRHLLLLLLAGACAREPPPPPTEPAAPHLVDAAWLRANRDEVVLVDMQSGRELYEKGHVKGAVYAHVEDFRDQDSYLDSVHVLRERLGRLGIDYDTHVVAYDEQQGRNAGWLWYVLHQLGHTQVSLLDGGMDGFREELEAGPEPRTVPAVYSPRKKPTRVVDASWVAGRRAGIFLIDARPVEQYTGEEPKKGMDPGHIPGALNVPWDSFCGADGRYVSVEAGLELLQVVPLDADVILYCNSYHVASHLHFQMDRLGYKRIRAFDGSMKEWLKEVRPLKTGSRP